MSAFPIRLMRATWRATQVLVSQVIVRIAWYALLCGAMFVAIRGARVIADALCARNGTNAWSIIEAKAMAGLCSGAAITLVMALEGSLERSNRWLAASWLWWSLFFSCGVLQSQTSDAGLDWLDDAALGCLFLGAIWIRWQKSKSARLTPVAAHA